MYNFRVPLEFILWDSYCTRKMNKNFVIRLRCTDVHVGIILMYKRVFDQKKKKQIYV